MKVERFPCCVIYKNYIVSNYTHMQGDWNPRGADERGEKMTVRCK
jgi:hypothetical protein